MKAVDSKIKQCNFELSFPAGFEGLAQLLKDYQVAHQAKGHFAANVLAFCVP